MENPWIRLPAEPPYVLTEDYDAVARANARSAERHRYRLHCMPVPYIGDLHAPVVLITLNPGYSAPSAARPKGDDDYWHDMQNDDARALYDAYWRNYRQEPSDYPMFLLDPRFAGYAGGRYWRNHLKELLSEIGAKTLASKLLMIEYFPYHSEEFNGGCSVPSQAFSLHQIRLAIQRNAVIVIARARTKLTKLVPELANYPIVGVRSPASGHVSRGNLRSPADFDRIIAACRQ